MLLLFSLSNNRFRATCCDSERPCHCENKIWHRVQTYAECRFCNIDSEQRKMVFQLSLGFGISGLGSRVQRFWRVLIGKKSPTQYPILAEAEQAMCATVHTHYNEGLGHSLELLLEDRCILLDKQYFMLERRDFVSIELRESRQLSKSGGLTEPRWLREFRATEGIWGSQKSEKAWGVMRLVLRFGHRFYSLFSTQQPGTQHFHILI